MALGEADWERARLFPVSGIGGADEQERRAASALLAVIQSVREFGRTITVPMGAPAGHLTAFIEVPFTDGDRHLRPDGLIEVEFGRRTWTALVEVKTGRHDLSPGQIESYLDLVRMHKFDALLTISHQLAASPGVHPCQPQLPRTRLTATRLHHMSWSQVRTQALLQHAEKGVSDSDQAWILAEFIRYLEHPRSGAHDFDDMGPAWVHVRDRAHTGTLHAQDKGAAAIADRFGWLVSYAAMRLSRDLGTKVRPMLSPVQLREPAKYMEKAVADLAVTGRLSGALRVPATVAPIGITADLRAGLVHCSVTVPAPREGRPTTRVNWLLRQLKSAPPQLCIEGTYAWQRGRGPARSLAEARANPKSLLDETGHELRAFTLTLSSTAGTARALGHGSFINSVLAATEKFYTEIVQHLRTWTPSPPRVRDDDGAGSEGQDVPADSGQVQPAELPPAAQYASSAVR